MAREGKKEGKDRAVTSTIERKQRGKLKLTGNCGTSAESTSSTLQVGNGKKWGETKIGENRNEGPVTNRQIEQEKRPC